MSHITFNKGKTLHVPNDSVVADKLEKTKFWNHIIDRLDSDVMAITITECQKKSGNFNMVTMVTKEERVAFLEEYLKHSKKVLWL